MPKSAYHVTFVAFNATVGGISSEISGGNFWEGFNTSAIIAVFNHLGHDGEKKEAKNPKVTGKFTTSSVKQGAYEVEVFKTETIEEGNSTTEIVVQGRTSVTIGHKSTVLGIFKVTVGLQDGSIAYGFSSISGGKTLDGRLVVSISIPTGDGKGSGGTLRIDPKVFSNNLQAVVYNSLQALTYVPSECAIPPPYFMILRYLIP